MKNKHLFGLTSLLLISSLHTALAVSSISLSTFGNNVEGDVWNWTPGTSTVSGNDAGGALLFPTEGAFAPVNLTTLNNYSGNPANLLLNITGFVTTSPGGAFTLTLEDSASNLSATPFTWASFTTSSSTVSVPINVTPSFLWNNVVGWTLDAGGTGNPVNATFTSLDVTAVPEPSTYALLALSGLAIGGYLIRRRRRA